MVFELAGLKFIMRRLEIEPGGNKFLSQGYEFNLIVTPLSGPEDRIKSCVSKLRIIRWQRNYC